MSSIHIQRQEMITIGSICSICAEEILTSSCTDANKQDGVKVPLPFKASNGDIINTLPCNHDFHDCFLTFWVLKSNTCPNCRCDLPKEIPVKSVLGRLILHLRTLLHTKNFKPSSYIFSMFNAFFYLLNQNPAANSGPHTKLFLLCAMQQLQFFTAALSSPTSTTTTSGVVTPHRTPLPGCSSCFGEISYVSSNGEYTCALCRCCLPKDITIMRVLEHFIWALKLKNLEVSAALVYRLFECILYLLVQDEENSQRAKRNSTRISTYTQD